MSRAHISAYPETAYYDGKPTHMVGGLTIRETFAMAALQGILAGNHPITHEPNCEATTAAAAVAMADALIVELQS